MPPGMDEGICVADIGAAPATIVRLAQLRVGQLSS